MPTNPYVVWWGDTAEQSLIHSLMTEAIQMNGFDVVYLPRTMRREDTLYNEDVLSQYLATYPIEVYIKDVAGWQGQGNFLSKFGLRLDHNVTIMMSVNRFNELIPLARPTEGDLIYFPQPINKMFEVKFVENEKATGQFYPLGTRTFFELTLELYTTNQEEIRTGNTDIDIFETNQSYAIDLVFAAGGSGTYTYQETVYQGTSILSATATGVVSSWDATTRTLKVVDITGEFANSVSVVGETSTASYVIGETPDTLTDPNDPTNDNRYLADNVDDFVESHQQNPYEG
jgi:hypothetical protein